MFWILIYLTLIPLHSNDFNINTEEINAVKELLLYFFNEINVISSSGFQIIRNYRESEAGM